MSFAVSVIIPVYNAEQFIEKAIDSALMFTEVNEVVVINDGSTDSSLELLLKLQEKDARIKIYHHKGAVNRGRSASRNLGILQAKSDYISFLDADDFYLKNRFQKDMELLRNKEIDGCYNAVGFHFYRLGKMEESHHFKISTLKNSVPPEELFENIVTSRLGYLHLNGLTIKKEALEKIGCFNEDLEVAEDTDLIFKLAMTYKLAASLIEEEVAKRGIHANNIFNQDHVYQTFVPLLFESLVGWVLENRLKFIYVDHLMNALWIHRFRTSQSLVKDTFYWLGLQMRLPKLCLTILPIKYFPIIRKRKQLFSFLYR
jgi:glycosyltransferase involved in cell wall biosynthesis